MRDHLGIGLALERPPARRQLIAQLLEIFDNAIVDERDLAGGMRMRIARCWRAVRRPAGVCNADIASRVVGFQDLHEVGKLALRPAADKLAVMHRANPGGVIPPILHPLQPIDQTVRNRRFANNSNNSAHEFLLSREWCRGRGYRASAQGSLWCFL